MLIIERTISAATATAAAAAAAAAAPLRPLPPTQATKCRLSCCARSLISSTHCQRMSQRRGGRTPLRRRPPFSTRPSGSMKQRVSAHQPQPLSPPPTLLACPHLTGPCSLLMAGYEVQTVRVATRALSAASSAADAAATAVFLERLCLESGLTFLSLGVTSSEALLAQGCFSKIAACTSYTSSSFGCVPLHRARPWPTTPNATSNLTSSP